jgi:SAM-dependent methyltransferase
MMLPCGPAGPSGRAGLIAPHHAALCAAGRRVPRFVTDPYDVLAPYYDLISAGDGTDVPLYAGLARRSAAPVLELGVGTGRVAVALAREGLTVYGVDASEAMLARARAKAAAAGVTLRLERADLCAYRFVERFGLIVCAADSFLHLCTAERQIAALRLAGSHLAPGGALVLDLPAFAGGWWEWEPGVRPLELVWSGTGPNGRPVQYFTTFTADPADQRRHVTHIVDEIGANGLVRRVTADFDLRFIFPAELPLLVAAAGLHLDAVYGGYDLEPFDTDAQRMIAVITRTED